jgi:hypothetical protein
MGLPLVVVVLAVVHLALVLLVLQALQVALD